MEQAHRLITIGELLYPFLKNKQKKEIDKGMKNLMSIGVTLPEFNEFAKIHDDLIESVGFPSQDTLEKKGRLLANKFYNDVYRPSAESWDKVIKAFRKHKQSN